MSCMQLCEGTVPMVYPIGMWARFSTVVEVLFGYG